MSIPTWAIVSKHGATAHLPPCTYTVVRKLLLPPYPHVNNSSGPHCIGKMAKNKNPCQGKHREFGNFAKTQRILFGQVVNSLNLKVKEITIFQISTFYRSSTCLPSHFCVCNSHNLCKLAQEKFVGCTGKKRKTQGI